MHSSTRECQSHWRKNFLPYIRYVATIPCESLRHKSNTFHTNISTLHTFISITLTETSIDKTNKTQQKSEAQNLCSKCPPFTQHMHSNDYATAESLPRWRCGPAASTPSADVLSTLSRHGSASGRPSLEAYPRCCSPPDSNLAN